MYLSDRPCFSGQASALGHNMSRGPGVSIGERMAPVMLRHIQYLPENYYIAFSHGYQLKVPAYYHQNAYKKDQHHVGDILCGNNTPVLD